MRRKMLINMRGCENHQTKYIPGEVIFTYVYTICSRERSYCFILGLSIIYFLLLSLQFYSGQFYWGYKSYFPLIIESSSRLSYYFQKFITNTGLKGVCPVSLTSGRTVYEHIFLVCLLLKNGIKSMFQFIMVT